MNMGVTAVVPTKNRIDLLRVTLRSILAQRDVEVEAVVVDDGPDPYMTVEVAALASESGDRVRLVRNPTSPGVSAARNQSVEAALTPSVAFCDDDLRTPGRLMGQVAAVEQTRQSWAYTGAVKFALGPLVWQVMPPPGSEEVVERLADECIVPAGACTVLAYRRTVLDSGGFDEDLMHVADWDMPLRLLEVSPPAVVDRLGIATGCTPGRRRCARRRSSPSSRRSTAAGGTSAGVRHWIPARRLWIAMRHLRAGQRKTAATAYLRAAGTRPHQGLRGFVRSFHPAPPTPAHRTCPDDDGLPTLKRVSIVELPAVTERMLAELTTSSLDGAAG